LRIKRTDWYQHIEIKVINDHIQKLVNRVGERENDYWYMLKMDIGSPEHGLLIDSQLSEELYSLYWHAEIMSEASSYISKRECQEYIQYKCH